MALFIIFSLLLPSPFCAHPTVKTKSVPSLSYCTSHMLFVVVFFVLLFLGSFFLSNLSDDVAYSTSDRSASFGMLILTISVVRMKSSKIGRF